MLDGQGLDARQRWIGKGGRTAVPDGHGLDAQQCLIGKGWTHGSAGLKRVDARQCVPAIHYLLITIY